MSALAGLATVVAGLALGLVGVLRQTRKEYEVHERPSDRAILGELVRENRIVFLLLAVYLGVFVLFDAGVLAAGVASAMIVLNWYVTARRTLGRTGVAFVATTAVCGVWTMFETFADAPRISMAVPWAVGLVTWIGATVVLRRRVA